ncbi:MAG TPA: dTMP kinase [Candidatus Limiplasma sp.]|nr:dTMP kinase [Candidatus Limiplasma sp.]HPS81629.1 dTMP kinase [Candidatus Limiplasma sp.]
MYSFPYDAVVFDLDGTLTCSDQGIIQSMLYALRQIGAEAPAGADLRAIIGPPLMTSLTGILGLAQDTAREAMGYYSDYFNREGMYLYTVYPHIRSILKMLRDGGVFVALATSKPVRPAMAILNHFGLTHFFNRIITEEDNEKLVNKPELIRRALPESYRRAAMVGDRFYDVEGALANGIDAIGAGYGFGSEEELTAAGATHVVPDTESLRAYLCPGASVPRGFFLSVEGLDGSGKTTQVDRLEQNLRDFGFSVLRTREPGGCEISEEIRHTILTTDHMEMCAACEALLYAASRAQHVHQVIRPAVERGYLVLCDRFVDSSIAYQGGGRELGTDVVCQINAPAVAGMLPDATVYLAIDHQRALARRHSASSLDRIEVESAAFHGRVQAAYEKLIREDPKRFLVIDGEQDVDTVAADVLDAVLNRIEPEIEA